MQDSKKGFNIPSGTVFIFIYRTVPGRKYRFWYVIRERYRPLVNCFGDLSISSSRKIMFKRKPFPGETAPCLQDHYFGIILRKNGLNTRRAGCSHCSGLSLSINGCLVFGPFFSKTVTKEQVNDLIHFFYRSIEIDPVRKPAKWEMEHFFSRYGPRASIFKNSFTPIVIIVKIKSISSLLHWKWPDSTTFPSQWALQFGRLKI